MGKDKSKDSPEIVEYSTTAEPKAYAGGIPVFCAHDAIVPTKDLCPNPKNPNQHPQEQIQLLGSVIRATGWRGPITVSTRSGMIVKGHGRLMAAVLEDMTEVPVDYQNYASEAEELADLTADNRIAELAVTDNKMLAEVFADIDTGEIPFLLSGYTEEDYGNIVTALSEAIHEQELEDPDEPVEPPAEPVTRRGDLWILGRHRLLCGDSTEIKDVRTLMDGALADMVFTDPPWNVNYGAVEHGNAQGYKPRTILNDFMGTEDFKNFMFSAFKCMNAASKDGAITYVVMSAQEWGNMMLTLAANDYHWSSTIIWNKDSLVLSRKDYHTKYEPIWYGWKDGARLCPLEDRTQSDVWDVPRPKKSEEHPTMKPVELVERAINNSSKHGNIILDLFGGSGTTLLASEQTGRINRSMELDPKYCDVIVKRYIRTTGKKDVRCVRQGKELSRDEIAAIFADDEGGGQE